MNDMARMEVVEHVRNHVHYPITKAELLTACNGLEHVPAETRQWMKTNLEDRTFNSAQDVLQQLKLQPQ